LRVVYLMNEWGSLHPSAILNYVPHRVERRALALFLCGDFPLARIDANWFCRGSLLGNEKRNCLHCANLDAPKHVLDSEEHMPFGSPRFATLRCRRLSSRAREKGIAFSSEDSAGSFRAVFTSRSPKLWRRFAWLLARIYSVRRRSWDNYNKARQQAACQRQMIRNRAPRTAKVPHGKKTTPTGK